MDLIDRYLQAVKFWLPKPQQQDILQELSVDIQSQVEDKEAELGHKLNEVEVADLLKRRGRPLSVAGGYLPQQHLIGPALFPVYMLVLKIVALFYLVPWIVVWICIMIFDAAYRGEHLGLKLVADWGTLWLNILFCFAVTTIVFAVIERVGARSKFQENWDPRKLPPVRTQKPPSRSGVIAGGIFHVVLIVWWLAVPHYPVLFFGPAAGFLKLAPSWRIYYWPVFFLAVAGLALHILQLIRPHWSWLRPVFGLGTSVIGLLILRSALKDPPFVLLANPAPVAVAGRYAAVLATINLTLWWSMISWFLALVVSGAVYTIQCLLHLWRLLRRHRGSNSHPAELPGGAS
jgi:hypothetical protein